MRHTFIICLFLALALSTKAQKAQDSIYNSKVSFHPTALILPAGLVTYGIMGIKNDPIRKWDKELRSSLKPNGRRTSIDDISLFVPIAGVYGLNMVGIEGKNDFIDRSVILATSTLFMYSTVNLIKNNTNIRRPSGRSVSSFPSGHTAIAFMGAEFLHQEFGDVSIWYSIGGYSIAAFTGTLRMYNDKHWFSDVLAGAGIGILSTKLGYWIHPFVKNLIFKKERDYNNNYTQLSFAPIYNGSEYVLSAGIKF